MFLTQDQPEKAQCVPKQSPRMPSFWQDASSLPRSTPQGTAAASLFSPVRPPHAPCRPVCARTKWGRPTLLQNSAKLPLLPHWAPRSIVCVDCSHPYWCCVHVFIHCGWLFRDRWGHKISDMPSVSLDIMCTLVGARPFVECRPVCGAKHEWAEQWHQCLPHQYPGFQSLHPCQHLVLCVFLILSTLVSVL
jgi:hypothetical protein